MEEKEEDVVSVDGPERADDEYEEDAVSVEDVDLTSEGSERVSADESADAVFNEAGVVAAGSYGDVGNEETEGDEGEGEAEE